MNRIEPNRNVYVGHRYVPLLVGEWDKSIQYEGLSIVTFKGASYTSKKMTPPGIDIENEEYWVLTGNYDAQVEYYRLETKRVSDDLAQAKIDLNERIDETEQYVDNETDSVRQYVDGETASAREYVDGETASARQYVDDELINVNEQLSESLNGNKPTWSVWEEFEQRGINVKWFGAKGDGVTDDRNAIQQAINFARDMGGGKVYLPSGTYVLGSFLILYSNIEFYGAGQYLTILYPLHDWDNSDAIRVLGEDENRAKNISLHDFRISGEDRMDNFDYEQIIGRMYLLKIDNLTIYNITSTAVSQLVFLRNCHKFSVDRIKSHYGNTAISLTSDSDGSDEIKDGVISNIIGDDVSTVIDFGAGGRDVVVSNIVGYHETFPLKEEGMDVGGSKNITVSDSIFKNFSGGAVVKGEAGQEWDNIVFDNVQFLDFHGIGLSVIRGSESAGGKITIKGCNLQSQYMPDDLSDVHNSAMNIRPNIARCEIFDTTVNVNANGLHGDQYDVLLIDNLEIICGGTGIFVESQNGWNDSYSIKDVNIDSGLTCIQINGVTGDNLLDNFTLKNDDGEGIFLNQVKSPKISNGTIKNVGGHGISLSFASDQSVDDLNGLNGLNATISNLIMEDWGNASTPSRSGLSFILPTGVTGTFKNLVLDNINFRLTDKANSNNRFGISWGNFEGNGVDYSVLKNIVFYNVENTESGVSNKGENMVNDVLVIK